MKTTPRLSRFTIAALLLAQTWASGVDVSYFGIVKSQQLNQTNSSAPVSLASNAWTFYAFVIASSNQVVTNAAVTPPGKPTRTLLSDSNGLSFRYEYTTNTQAQLDALFPSPAFLKPANFTLTMGTVNDGVRSATLGWSILGLPISYPSAAQVVNFDEVQNIDPTVDFELRWAVPGGNSLQILQLSVLGSSSNIVFASPMPFSDGALNGASSSVVIPAYSLPPGASLQAHLTIAQPALPNTNDYAGAIGVPALAKDTAFSMWTRPAAPPPKLEILPAAGEFHLRVLGESNRTYQILASADLLAWSCLLITNSESGSFDFADPPAAASSRRFYRAKVGR